MCHLLQFLRRQIDLPTELTVAGRIGRYRHRLLQGLADHLDKHDDVGMRWQLPQYLQFSDESFTRSDFETSHTQRVILLEELSVPIARMFWLSHKDLFLCLGHRLLKQLLRCKEFWL